MSLTHGGRVPPLAEFERAARGVFEGIPSEYREGVDTLRVRRAALPHPALADVYTLGECRPIEWASPLGGPAEIRSEIVLYHGSFRRLADLDPDFDWEAELWETVSHELRHHLEFRADVSTLEARDFADDQEFRRAAGEPFDPLFYEYGEVVGSGIYRVEDNWFVEGRVSPDDPEVVLFRWRGHDCRARAPGPLARVTYLRVDGLEAGPGDVRVVAKVGSPWRSWLASLLGRRSARPPIVEYQSAADCSDDTHDESQP